MAWNLLLSSDIGLLSLFTILFMIGMVAYLIRYVAKHVKAEEREAENHKLAGKG